MNGLELGARLRRWGRAADRNAERMAMLEPHQQNAALATYAPLLKRKTDSSTGANRRRRFTIVCADSSHGRAPTRGSGQQLHIWKSLWRLAERADRAF